MYAFLKLSARFQGRSSTFSLHDYNIGGKPSTPAAGDRENMHCIIAILVYKRIFTGTLKNNLLHPDVSLVATLALEFLIWFNMWLHTRFGGCVFSMEVEFE